MLDLSFFQNYIVVVIVGICLCIGYVIKTSFNFISNKYIPLIMAVIGIVLNIWISKTVNADILLGGLASGLASTGMHQAFKNLIDRESKVK
ncbi:MAG: phage holin family protein [Terrisporobacter sp.]